MCLYLCMFVSASVCVYVCVGIQQQNEQGNRYHIFYARNKEKRKEREGAIMKEMDRHSAVTKTEHKELALRAGCMPV